jgi:hypothetical protein
MVERSAINSLRAKEVRRNGCHLPSLVDVALPRLPHQFFDSTNLAERCEAVDSLDHRFVGLVKHP